MQFMKQIYKKQHVLQQLVLAAKSALATVNKSCSAGTYKLKTSILLGNGSTFKFFSQNRSEVFHVIVTLRGLDLHEHAEEEHEQNDQNYHCHSQPQLRMILIGRLICQFS